MSATKRLFIGLMADDAVRAELATYQSHWTWPDGANLVLPGNFHLTLRFLGATDPAVEANLLDTLSQVPIEPFDLHLGSPGTFDGGIAWVGPAASPHLDALHERVSEAVTLASVAPTHQKWIPHLTLARRSAGAKPPATRLRLSWRIKHFSLVHSDGGRYLPIASWPSDASRPA